MRNSPSGSKAGQAGDELKSTLYGFRTTSAFEKSDAELASSKTQVSLGDEIAAERAPKCVTILFGFRIFGTPVLETKV